MDQLIHAFGINLKLIITQIINFVLLAGILTYFLYKPLLTMLNTREEKISQGIKDAEAAATAKATADEEKRKILAAAQQRAEEMNTNAKQYAEEEAEEIVTIAHQKAATLLKDAEAKAKAAHDQAIDASEAEIAKLAILAAEKVLTERTS